MLPRILILNGPNLNLIGVREPELYGTESFESFFHKLLTEYGSRLELVYFQTQQESELVEQIHKSKKSFQAVILNPGAYTHSSIALRDAILATSQLCIEVHLSDIRTREHFRKHSMISDLCWCTIQGYGLNSYKIAIERMLEYFKVQYV